ncbi:MAG: PTS sugar transporter subunit IIA, partial [Planctomycetota bacterium]
CWEVFPMMLADFLSEETIVCPLLGRSRIEIVNELLNVLDWSGHLRSKKEVLSAIEEREKISCTAIGNGIALPHARTDAVDGIALALGVSKKGIDFCAADGFPVNIVCLILAPPANSTVYLQLLASLAQLMKDEKTKNSLIAATSPEEILQMVQKSAIELGTVIKVKDIMKPVQATVQRKTSLKEALDLMLKNNVSEIPVVDDRGNLVGEIIIESVLKIGLPDYIFSIDSLAFLESFEPFERLLQQEDKLRVSDVMSHAAGVVDVDSPMIQAAISLLQHKLRNVIVTENSKPVGVVSALSFVGKVLRA